MSGAADVIGAAPEPSSAQPGWLRLERAVYDASAVMVEWRRRALEAEAEVARLRGELEAVAAPGGEAGADSAEARRLRAENALLTSRADEARTRIRGLLAKLAILEQRR